MWLVTAVLVQTALLLYCYQLALRRNARRLQLWVVSQPPGAVHVRCDHNWHGMRVCGTCRDRILHQGYT